MSDILLTTTVFKKNILSRVRSDPKGFETFRVLDPKSLSEHLYFALDVLGLPEVIQTSVGNTYLHLPGVIMVENSTGEVRYLLSDGLGSVRQAVDENAEVVASYEFDPYGNPADNVGGEPYGYTDEWWEDEVGLLHLRARWY